MKRMFTAMVLPIIFTIFAATAASPSSRQAATETDLAERVADNLSKHADGEVISDWLHGLDPTSLEFQAASWILAWLPPGDLVALTPTLLGEHVEVAAQSYRQAPWREQLPLDLWLHFVVPHRVSQEPLQPWRRVIRRQLWPRVKGAPDMESAALEVNRWCREQATFKSTSGRDQGPLTTMKRGIGRCEEEMILTICALRAVGIPARSCATPYWTFTDNNHAWVETWADGDWYYLGGCEPDRCLNRAWFTGAARRAGFVRSVGYGEFDPVGEALYRSEKGSTIINSTAVYTEPFTLTAELAGVYRDCEQREIHINVLNFGSLRSIARIDAGGSIELGPGEYAVTGGPRGELLLEVAGGVSGDRVEVVLDENDLYDLTRSPPFWLRYPASDRAPERDLDLVDETTQQLMELRIEAAAADRDRLRRPNDEEREYLAALDDETRERLEEILTKPMERVSKVFLLLRHYEAFPGREALLAFLELADDKDLLELDERQIRSHIDGALEAREHLAPLGLAIPDTIFIQGLLPCRIQREPGGDWRPGLPLFPLEQDIRATLQVVREHWREGLLEMEGGFFGNPLPPDQCWRLGRGTRRDLDICLVGLLRRNGFPARYRHGKIDLWLDGWTVLEVDDERSNQTTTVGGSGRMVIGITRGGIPWPAAESYRHFNVSRPRDGHLDNPWWDPATGEQEWDGGDFILSTTMRVPGGSVCGRLRGFTVEPGETTAVNLGAEIVDGGWDPGDDLFSGPSVQDTEEVLARLTSEKPLTGDGLYFMFLPGEPATRMITALGNLVPRLEADRIEIRPILIGAADPQPWREKLIAAALPPHLSIDDHHLLPTLLSAGEEFLPLVMLKSGGKVHLLRQGFDTRIDDTVHLVLDLLRRE